MGKQVQVKSQSELGAAKKQYTTPKLVVYGNAAQLTQGVIKGDYPQDVGGASATF